MYIPSNNKPLATRFSYSKPQFMMNIKGTRVDNLSNVIINENLNDVVLNLNRINYYCKQSKLSKFKLWHFIIGYTGELG